MSSTRNAGESSGQADQTPPLRKVPGLRHRLTTKAGFALADARDRRTRSNGEISARANV
jgi:hypothetical protein